MRRKQFVFWATSQKLPANGFNCVENLSKFNEDFIKSYNEKSNERYFLKVHKDLSFWPEIKKVNKVKKLVANFHDKKEHIIHIGNIKQALNYGLVLKEIHSFCLKN